MSQHACIYCLSTDGCDCLARIRCDEVGTAGHHACGICHVHSLPRFMCGCLAFERPVMVVVAKADRHLGAVGE